MTAERVGYPLPPLTPTQERLLRVLADGQPHSESNLFQCLDDELSQLITVRIHISLLRRKVRQWGHEILAERGDVLSYRYVKIMLPDIVPPILPD